MSRVAACIIGDEVLAGRTLDTNSNYLAKKCFDYGLHLAHVRIIPDDKIDIIDNIKELSSKYSLVFTSGGIGPTHDDITYGSIGEACGVSLVDHEPTIEKMRAYYKKDTLNDGQMRMARIPKPDHVFSTNGLWVPLVQTKNVLILPGVPMLFQRMLDSWFDQELKRYVEKGEIFLSPRKRISVKTFWKESDLAEKLTQIQESVRQLGIALGSYPKLFEDGSTHVIISISGPADQNSEIERCSFEIIKSFEGEPIDFK